MEHGYLERSHAFCFLTFDQSDESNFILLLNHLIGMIVFTSPLDHQRNGSLHQPPRPPDPHKEQRARRYLLQLLELVLVHLFLPVQHIVTNFTVC